MTTETPSSWNVTRYTITGALELAGAVHIGSGGGGLIGSGDSLTDATVIRDSSGRPYIPGSSLRGVLRTAISEYAAVLGLGVIREDTLIDEQVRHAEDELVITADSSEAAVQDMLEATLSPAERLFGTVYWASPLLIPDLHLMHEQTHVGEIRHGVGIDRDTGAARDTLKYDFEVLPRGLRFGLWMRCDVPYHYRTAWSRLLALGLHLLQQGELPVGGRLARGVGQVRLDDLKIYQLDLGQRQALLKSLLARDADNGRYGSLQATWMADILKEIENVCQTTQ